VFDRVEYGTRLLRRGGAIEVHQRPAVDLTRQDRKISAYAFGTELIRHGSDG
jgi:hypothetical protein